MENLWLILLPPLLYTLIVIIIIILSAIDKEKDKEKEKHYRITVLLMIICLAVIWSMQYPFIQDLFQNTTNEIVCTYEGFYIGNGRGSYACAKSIYFKTDYDKIKIYTPIFSDIYAKLEKGKKYRIVYFENSKTIKEYTPIE